MRVGASGEYGGKEKSPRNTGINVVHGGSHGWFDCATLLFPFIIKAKERHASECHSYE